MVECARAGGGKRQMVVAGDIGISIPVQENQSRRALTLHKEPQESLPTYIYTCLYMYTEGRTPQASPHRGGLQNQRIKIPRFPEPAPTLFPDHDHLTSAPRIETELKRRRDTRLAGGKKTRKKKKGSC